MREWADAAWFVKIGRVGVACGLKASRSRCGMQNDGGGFGVVEQRGVKRVADGG